MNLSPNFTLIEAIYSDTAAKLDLDNTPDEVTLNRMKETAAKMELVRALLGTPILINSWYRSLEVNRAVRSSDTSQHRLGEAVDFRSPKFGTPRQVVEFLKASILDFDQLILEFDSWVHISFRASKNRKQALIIDNKGTRLFS